MDVEHNDSNQNVMMNGDHENHLTNGHSTEDSAFAEEPLLNGHHGDATSNLSTSPSKQKVIDTISEVINDRLLEDNSATSSMLLTDEKEKPDQDVASTMQNILGKVESTQNSATISPSQANTESPTETLSPISSTNQSLTPLSDTFDSPSDKTDVSSPSNHVETVSQNNESDDKTSSKDAMSGVVEKEENPLPEEPVSSPNEHSGENHLNINETELDSETLVIESDAVQNSKESSTPEETLDSVKQDIVMPEPTELIDSKENIQESKNEINETKNAPIQKENTESTTESLSTDSDVPTNTTGTDESNEKEAKKPAEELDMLGNGLLKKKILKEGLGRESRPQQGDLVNIRCEGKLADGTVVDKQSHLQLVLGDADVIQAMDMCVALMEDKETCTLYTDARYAYGLFGRLDYKPAIPKNASITYEIEILSIERGVPLQELSPQECSLRADKKRGRGNDLYSRGDYAGAIDVYKRALKYLEGRTDKELLDMKVKCLNNLSAAQLKVKAYIMALQSLDIVLELEPKNVKALFRKGKCLEHLGKENAAFECMKKAAALDPENKLITQDLGRLQKRVAVTQQKEKQIYQRMFQQNTKQQTEEGGDQGGEGEEEEEEEEEEDYLPLIGSLLVAAAACVGGLLWYRYR
ncbi:peptidyl-prolyl cis-trans isomerase FKBP8-like [Clytia hemisphaerica]|uniref:peptidylprolyl isomerase n=1 Tax=Clytia hemisphaerica TaxID=252671 RepID=A0A7M5TT80_9CNID